MKEKMLNLVYSSKFGGCTAIALGAIVTFCMYKTGVSIGYCDGATDTNDKWMQAIEYALKRDQKKEL